MFGQIRKWLGKQDADKRVSEQWHSEIMAMARDPEPFLRGWVTDTLEGRFAMASLVTILVLRRLRDIGSEGRALADGVYREVFSGFDHALREHGVGDSSIARRMRKMGEEFFGLARAIDAALAGKGDEPLAEVLRRNGIIKADEHKEALADWVMLREGELARLDEAALLAGQVGWRKLA
ncbi:ubiquinol-cytochrome C chaperone family protein [Hyphomonas sp. FCG-A18]|uniref:ubiquinol-cytochrome C chaperone family protein n=1 Tax=Hyphomonas sp. FCG-A18 TaxID=3080019 RepID=UPI002B287E79|nr:ubiquinol-cytochrome C chaperone family protein [Hyphomonas sp. FCG-A18]